jgi:hypothetical protein
VRMAEEAFLRAQREAAPDARGAAASAGRPLVVDGLLAALMPRFGQEATAISLCPSCPSPGERSRLSVGGQYRPTRSRAPARARARAPLRAVTSTVLALC